MCRQDTPDAIVAEAQRSAEGGAATTDGRGALRRARHRAGRRTISPRRRRIASACSRRSISGRRSSRRPACSRNSIARSGRPLPPAPIRAGAGGRPVMQKSLQGSARRPDLRRVRAGLRRHRLELRPRHRASHGAGLFPARARRPARRSSASAIAVEGVVRGDGDADRRRSRGAAILLLTAAVLFFGFTVRAARPGAGALRARCSSQRSRAERTSVADGARRWRPG